MKLYNWRCEELSLLASESDYAEHKDIDKALGFMNSGRKWDSDISSHENSFVPINNKAHTPSQLVVSHI